jgi:hypothetical protein
VVVLGKTIVALRCEDALALEIEDKACSREMNSNGEPSIRSSDYYSLVSVAQSSGLGADD